MSPLARYFRNEFESLFKFVSNFFRQRRCFYSPIVNFLNDLDELTSINAKSGHFGNQPPFRSKKRNSREV